MKVIELHSAEAVTEEAKRLTSPPLCLFGLITAGWVRSWCYEEDLRTLAYNSLSQKFFGGTGF